MGREKEKKMGKNEKRSKEEGRKDKREHEGETKFPNAGSFVYRLGFPLAQDAVSFTFKKLALRD